jgi:hypothetical protein
MTLIPMGDPAAAFPPEAGPLQDVALLRSRQGVTAGGAPLDSLQGWILGPWLAVTRAGLKLPAARLRRDFGVSAQSNAQSSRWGIFGEYLGSSLEKAVSYISRPVPKSFFRG